MIQHDSLWRPAVVLELHFIPFLFHLKILNGGKKHNQGLYCLTDRRFPVSIRCSWRIQYCLIACSNWCFFFVCWNKVEEELLLLSYPPRKLLSSFWLRVLSVSFKSLKCCECYTAQRLWHCEALISAHYDGRILFRTLHTHSQEFVKLFFSLLTNMEYHAVHFLKPSYISLFYECITKK